MVSGIYPFFGRHAEKLRGRAAFAFHLLSGDAVEATTNG
jgi:hypothetical protein